jgi:signal recognition particle GTPase
MRITEVNIPESPEDGLKEIKMSRLSNIVLIAGKNGAGKTRILNKIFEVFKQKPKKSALEMALVNIHSLSDALQCDISL